MQQQVQTDFLDTVIASETRLRTAELALVNDALPIGSLIEWPLASNLLPANWLVANGAAVDRGTYGTLFSIYGTTFGVGDGATSFNVPIYNSANALPMWTTFVAASVFAVNYSDFGGAFTTCAFSKDTNGIVSLRGLCKKAGAPFVNHGPEQFGTLPVGYRPNTGTEIFIVGGSSTANYSFRFDVGTNGAIVWSELNGAAWDGNFLSVGGVSFDSANVTTNVASTAPPYIAIKAA